MKELQKALEIINEFNGVEDTFDSQSGTTYELESEEINIIFNALTNANKLIELYRELRMLLRSKNYYSPREIIIGLDLKNEEDIKMIETEIQRLESEDKKDE